MLIFDRTIGNCAIAVGANERHSTTWDMLRSVAETLIATCVSNPASGTLGGTAISQTTRSWRRGHSLGRRQKGERDLSPVTAHRRLIESQERLQVAFPPTFEVAVYLQPPFNGPADTTCSWGVVSSHQGDVRQCPASSAPIRPPERNLGTNATLARNLTGPIISIPSLNETIYSTAHPPRL